MPKILCRCGEEIEDISIPNPNGRLLITEEALDQIETNGSGEELIVVFDKLSDEGCAVYECPTCKRLIVFPEGKGGAIKWYQLEA